MSSFLDINDAENEPPPTCHSPLLSILCSLSCSRFVGLLSIQQWSIMEKIDKKLLENKEYLNFGQQCLGVIRKLLIALIEDHLEQE